MAPRGTFPDVYGTPTRALPDIKGPLNIDSEGDHVPPNDMAEIPDGACPDPLDLVNIIESQGRKR
jgi:hypothetical protein